MLMLCVCVLSCAGILGFVSWTRAVQMLFLNAKVLPRETRDKEHIFIANFLF